jgi:hypothetical protein
MPASNCRALRLARSKGSPSHESKSGLSGRYLHFPDCLHAFPVPYFVDNGDRSHARSAQPKQDFSKSIHNEATASGHLPFQARTIFHVTYRMPGPDPVMIANIVSVLTVYRRPLRCETIADKKWKLIRRQKRVAYRLSGGGPEF